MSQNKQRIRNLSIRATWHKGVYMKFMSGLRVIGVSLLILGPSFAYADGWKWRAREHFEWHRIEVDGVEAEYRGLSNTVNFWHEKAFDQAYGFAIGPLLGAVEAKDDDLEARLGKEIQVYNLGFETKQWLSEANPFFGRLGITYQIIDSDGSLDNPTGVGLYVGAGYEFTYRGVGIALEFAYRQAYLSNDTTNTTITPSIGFHFYPFM